MNRLLVRTLDGKLIWSTSDGLAKMMSMGIEFRVIVRVIFERNVGSIRFIDCTDKTYSNPGVIVPFRKVG